MEKDVHTEHCCSIHGCKYGPVAVTACTVVDGSKKQSYSCEICVDVEEERSYWIERLRTEGYTVTKEA